MLKNFIATFWFQDELQKTAFQSYQNLQNITKTTDDLRPCVHAINIYNLPLENSKSLKYDKKFNMI